MILTNLIKFYSIDEDSLMMVENIEYIMIKQHSLQSLHTIYQDNVPPISPPGKFTKSSERVERISRLQEGIDQQRKELASHIIHRRMYQSRHNSTIPEISCSEQWMF